MSRLLPRSVIHNRIVPLDYDPAARDYWGAEEDKAWEQHVKTLPAIINEMERDISRRAGHGAQKQNAARATFVDDLLIIAGELLRSDFLFVVNVGLKVAAIAAVKNADRAGVEGAFAHYEAYVAAGAKERDDLIRDMEKSQLAVDIFVPSGGSVPSWRRSPIFIGPSQIECQKNAQFIYEVAVANGLFEAAAMLTPETVLARRLHKQAVQAIRQISRNSIGRYHGVIQVFGVLCEDAETYPGGGVKSSMILMLP
jgi:hypothetical protein